MQHLMDAKTAQDFLENENVLWYQRFNIGPDMVTPGQSSGTTEWTLDRLGVPERLDGLSVLDIGTTNGAVAFICEQRGARRVVAADICEESWFGFDRLKSALGSRVEFVRGSIYELPQILQEQFDLVFFLGVLYHLRHPLLAIDSLFELTRKTLYIESAITGEADDAPTTNFYRLDEMSGDGSNWFVPTLSCTVGWIASSGFSVERADCWPEINPSRGLVVANREPGPPEYVRTSYELPLRATIQHG